MQYHEEQKFEWGNDDTVWMISWVRDAGCFFVDRFVPEDEADFDLESYVATPVDDFAFVESLEDIERAVGRPLPSDVREALAMWSVAEPIRPERLASWTEWDAYGITRQTPTGEWIETFAPPGHPDPFALRWLPEHLL